MLKPLYQLYFYIQNVKFDIRMFNFHVTRKNCNSGYFFIIKILRI